MGKFFSRFEFSISLSQNAAEKHAEETSKLEIITSESGEKILSKQH